MGTRNLVMVVSEGQNKVAQYGQWDGYPDGVGIEVLEFVRNMNTKNFKKKLELVRFATEDDCQEVDRFLEEIGCQDGRMNMAQVAKYKKRFPLLSRDIGATILTKIMELEKETFIKDSSDFAGDSLFCEWAYVIDLDLGYLEVYEGFKRTELTKEDRFYYLQDDKEEYKPVKLLHAFNLKYLPTNEEFIDILSPKKEEQ